MSVAFQTYLGTGTSGNAQVPFTTTVLSADVAIRGFTFDYGADTDQYIDWLKVQITNVNVNGSTVSFSWNANMAAEDNTTTSGSNTQIDFLVIASTASN